MTVYAWEILVQIDILISSIIPGWVLGPYRRHITISERAALARTSGCAFCRFTGGAVCWLTEFFDQGHCDEYLAKSGDI